MPWQFRKRLRLGPGIHLNVGKKSVSLSVGGHYSRTSLSTTGHATQTYALPGTGLYRRERTRVFGSGKLPRTNEEPISQAESSYAQGLQAYLDGDFETARRGFETAIKKRVGAISADFFAGVSLFQLGRIRNAIPHLERVVESDQELPDALSAKYAPPDHVNLRFEIALVQGIYCTLDFESLAAALMLAEAYQADGQRDKAISLMGELLELLPDNEAIRVSLCDLLFEAADFEGTVEVASPASPKTNLGFVCHVFKSQGESWIGDLESAKQTLESALSETDADDKHALEAARANLTQAYADLGLSSKRLAAFDTALKRRKAAKRNRSRGSHTVAYESEPYSPAGGDEPADRE